jgi:hypothetical protein
LVARFNANQRAFVMADCDPYGRIPPAFRHSCDFSPAACGAALAGVSARLDRATWAEEPALARQAEALVELACMGPVKGHADVVALVLMIWAEVRDCCDASGQSLDRVESASAAILDYFTPSIPSLCALGAGYLGQPQRGSARVSTGWEA